MQSLESLLTAFKKPDLTPEQWAENDAACLEWETQQAEASRLQHIADAGIPSGYANLESGDQRIIEWAEHPTKGLLIQGKVGRGKTHNACIALQVALERGDTALFTTFDDLLRECKATFRNTDTEKAVIGRYANVGMLCIDDMGKERLTEWSLPIVFAIINKRSMNLKPTIVTTQYTGRQLVERMTVNGDSETARAVISRFFEYTRVMIEGKDWRRG